MIYAGLIYFNETSDKARNLHTVLKAYTQTSPTVIKKNSLILCYGKLSDENDVDEIWENDSSLLMGRLFDKTHHCAFAKQGFKSLSSLNKEEILGKVWGKYVALYADAKGVQFNIDLASI